MGQPFPSPATAPDNRDDYRAFHQRRYRLILDMFSRQIPTKLDRCLDIGGSGDVAGTGSVLKQRFANEVYAADLPEYVEQAASKGSNAVACNIDYEDLPFDNAYFDLVIMASVIEHLYNPYHAISEIARVTKPGGLFLIEAPNAIALGRRIDAVLGHNPFRFLHEYNAFQNKVRISRCSVFYTADEAARLLSPYFHIIDTEHGMHSPTANPIKKSLRELAFHLNPRFGDFFCLIGRRM